VKTSVARVDLHDRAVSHAIAARDAHQHAARIAAMRDEYERGLQRDDGLVRAQDRGVDRVDVAHAPASSSSHRALLPLPSGLRHAVAQSAPRRSAAPRDAATRVAHPPWWDKFRVEASAVDLEIRVALLVLGHAREASAFALTRACREHGQDATRRGGRLRAH
jgi:hypothetical protein